MDKSQVSFTIAGIRRKIAREEPLKLRKRSCSEKFLKNDYDKVLKVFNEKGIVAEIDKILGIERETLSRKSN